MGLTKINFNSCLHNDRLPVTSASPMRLARKPASRAYHSSSTS